MRYADQAMRNPLAISRLDSPLFATHTPSIETSRMCFDKRLSAIFTSYCISGDAGELAETLDWQPLAGPFSLRQSLRSCFCCQSMAQINVQEKRNHRCEVGCERT